jgi:hypothetical protein
MKFSRATSRVKWLEGEVFSTLRMRTEMVPETLVFSPFNHLTRLVARKNFIIIVNSLGCSLVLFLLRLFSPVIGHYVVNNRYLPPNDVLPFLCCVLQPTYT